MNVTEYHLSEQNRKVATDNWRVIFILTTKEWIELSVARMATSWCLLFMLTPPTMAAILGISNFHDSNEYVKQL